MKYKGQNLWIYVTHKDHSFSTQIKDLNFSNAWFEIVPDGMITIKGTNVQSNGKGGYAWDGCSPKVVILDAVLGIPDGIPETKLPITWEASMVHDALYQFSRYTGVTRKQADVLFLQMLTRARFRA